VIVRTGLGIAAEIAWTRGCSLFIKRPIFQFSVSEALGN
jgi:hypothetical protein